MENSAHPGGVLGPLAAALRAALLQPFLRLNFVTLWIRDQARSRRFFVEKLDFEALVDVQTPEGGRWIVVAPPAAGWHTGTAGGGGPRGTLRISPAATPRQPPPPPKNAASFFVSERAGLFLVKA